MADLATILKDPNFVNANAATKQAIFDKWAPQDPNFANANTATQDAIRQKFGVIGAVAEPTSTPASSVQPATAVPAPELTTGQKIYQAIRPYAAPLVEAGGAIGGGLLGATAGTFGAGPVGTAVGGVSGAGLGYGIAKEGLEAADVAMGMKKPRQGAAQVTEPIKNVLEGATYEAGGQAAGPILGKVIGKTADFFNRPQVKATELARNALGDADIQQAVNALRNAPKGASVAEATAGIENPAWQALVRNSLERSQGGAQYLRKFANMSEQESINALSKLAGGSTAAEARSTVESMKNALNEMTGPAREAALNRANLGKAVADYESQAGKLGAEAANEVQKVRDLISAGNSAEAWARLQLIKQGKPVGLTKYTYPGQLAEKAFGEWSSKAADASLDLGQGARFAQGAADAMRSVGIKPLEGEPLVRSIKSIGNNPEFAGNDVLQGALKNVAEDIAKWTSGGGVIDARALDAIRKNSVNAAVQQLRPGMDATAQRNLAAGVLSDIKPALIGAIEDAGGTGYRQYLENYAKGMQRINERKLTGEALRLWKTDKDAFVRLVQNESPETVEKFLGKGNYNIASELANDTMDVLRQQAQKRITQLSVDEQVTEGKKALTTILNQTMSKFRLPNMLNFWASATNKALSELEKAAGPKTMKILSESMQSPEATANLIESLPAQERNKILALISDPTQWSAAKIATGEAALSAKNALSTDQKNKNSLRIELRGMANKE